MSDSTVTVDVAEHRRADEVPNNCPGPFAGMESDDELAASAEPVDPTVKAAEDIQRCFRGAKERRELSQSEQLAERKAQLARAKSERRTVLSNLKGLEASVEKLNKHQTELVKSHEVCWRCWRAMAVPVSVAAGLRRLRCDTGAGSAVISHPIDVCCPQLRLGAWGGATFPATRTQPLCLLLSLFFPCVSCATLCFLLHRCMHLL